MSTVLVEPTSALKDLVQYVVKHYVPMSFYIRQHSTCEWGSRHIFQSIQLLRELPERRQSVIRPAMQRNGYWTTPEQILLSMEADPDRTVREHAVHRISAARQEQTEQEQVRMFAILDIHFGTAAYTELINWTGQITASSPERPE